MSETIPMLSESEIQRVQAIVVNQLDVKPEQVTLDAKFSEDLGADSLDMVEIAMTIEEQFGVTSAESEIEEVKSVEDLYGSLVRLLGRQESA